MSLCPQQSHVNDSPHKSSLETPEGTDPHISPTLNTHTLNPWTLPWSKTLSDYIYWYMTPTWLGRDAFKQCCSLLYLWVDRSDRGQVLQAAAPRCLLLLTAKDDLTDRAQLDQPLLSAALITPLVLSNKYDRTHGSLTQSMDCV